jgi:glycosyltransferase involved in cell wall biosynthesis
LRIAVIAHHSAPVATPFAGGLEAMTWYLTRWLARRGHEVTLFAPPGSDVPGAQTEELELHLPVSDLARRDVSMPPDRFMEAHYAYQRLMSDLVARRHRFDLIHVHALHYLPVALSEMLPTPMVLTLHSPPTPWLEAALRASRRRPWLVAVSRACAQMWKISDAVIPNGIDLDVWPSGPGGPTLAWTGRVVPEKAPHLAIDAARRTGRVLRIAGPILDRHYFTTEIEPRLGPETQYVGHLGHEPLGAMLATSTALLQTPIWDEPFGLTAAEAMATGTPVVAFARGGVPEVVARGGGLLVTPGDIAGLAAAAQTASGLDREGVRDHARATFGIDRAGHAYEGLFDRALTGERPTAQLPAA